MNKQTKIILALCGTLIIALVIIAFLAGRITTPQTQPVVVIKNPGSNPDIQELPANSTTQIPTPIIYNQQPQNPPNNNQSFPSYNNNNNNQNSGHNQNPEMPANNVNKQAIQQYLNDISGPLNIASDLSNPQDLAQSAVNSALNGDTSYFDNLISDCQRVKGQLSAISVPPECQNYQRLAVQSIDDSSSIIRELKSAIVSKDMQRITNLQQRSNIIKTNAKLLEEEKKRLESLCGM